MTVTPGHQEYHEVFLTAPLSNDELITELTGNPVSDREEAILENGYDLVVQKLDQIPEPARKIIRGAWGENFESYNLAPGNGPIKGIRCRITEDQWERLADWEFEEFGWFKPTDVEIRNLVTGKVEKVKTMVMGDGQQFDRKVDGYDFNQFLMPKGKTLEVARIARKFYDERMGLTPERSSNQSVESKG